MLLDIISLTSHHQECIKPSRINLYCVCSTLDDQKLLGIGVLDANHRRAILHKATSNVDDDFSNMLGDLSSVIKDLEMFSVVS